MDSTGADANTFETIIICFLGLSVVVGIIVYICKMSPEAWKELRKHLAEDHERPDCFAALGFQKPEPKDTKKT
jgi:hypothetical protein